MPEQSTAARQRGGIILVLAFVGLVILVAGYFALGMPGMDHGGSRTEHPTEGHR